MSSSLDGFDNLDSELEQKTERANLEWFETLDHGVCRSLCKEVTTLLLRYALDLSQLANIPAPLAIELAGIRPTSNKELKRWRKAKILEKHLVTPQASALFKIYKVLEMDGRLDPNDQIPSDWLQLVTEHDLWTVVWNPPTPKKKDNNED